MGKNPSGYVVFNAGGRVFLVLTGEARKPAKTSQERAELFTTLIAYTGTYRLEGDKWTTKVEVAWIPEWVGTEQVRSLTVDGERLQVLSPWRVNPNWPDKGMTRSIVTFVRSNRGAADCPDVAPSVTPWAHTAFPELRADRPYHQPGDDSRP
jgi:Lipocalin-like domain